MQHRQRTVDCFDNGWKFLKGDPDGAHHTDHYDRDWRELDLPHDWSIEGPVQRENPSGPRGGFLPGGIGWYRKHFTLPQENRAERYVVQFDGIYKNSEVWINGHHLGRRPGGYVSFFYDLTPHLRSEGENVIAVRVDNARQPSCRWYSGSGIYRHVWLIGTTNLYIPQWGTCITTPKVSGESATATFETRVENQNSGPVDIQLVTQVDSPRGEPVAELRSEGRVRARSDRVFTQTRFLQQPRLWKLEDPALYRAISRLYVGDRLADDCITSFGIRTAVFRPREGFLLNGEPVKMKGVCIHHDAGCLGAAVPKRALRRRLEVLKDMGCNAIRTSHNPPAPELLDLCDEMGFLVIDEAFDKWVNPTYGYGDAFEDWWEEDLHSMLQRDKNHPSVILWSVGNEVGGQGTGRMKETLRKLVHYVHENEPTRHVTCALRPPKEEGTGEKIESIVGLARHMDVLSCNYQEQWYEGFNAMDPDLVIIGTESYPYFRGRGDRFKAFEPQSPWFDVLKHDYVVGQFLWTGIDYLGEARRWPSKGWSAAPIDTCGFRKPRFYYYQSLWTREPMVHIAVYDDSIKRNPEKPHWSWPKIVSHWNFPQWEGDLVRLATYTNCDEVELLLNGESYGIKQLSEAPHRRLTWFLPYEAGEVEAIGIVDGVPVCSHKLKTAGDAAGVELVADRKRIRADGRDLAHVKATIVDNHGIPVPDDERELSFAASGEGRILGIDNGDLRDGEPYASLRRRTYRGRCLAVLQSMSREGEIVLGCETVGLQGARVCIATESPSNPSGH